VDLYIHSPIRLRGVVLNFLSTGTTLPLRFSSVALLKGTFQRDVFFDTEEGAARSSEILVPIRAGCCTGSAVDL
jgi:hypothetical protein